MPGAGLKVGVQDYQPVRLCGAESRSNDRQNKSRSDDA